MVVFGVDPSVTAAQLGVATADSKTFLITCIRHKEIYMTTNQPIELGRVSEETKHTGIGEGDSFMLPTTDPQT